MIWVDSYGRSYGRCVEDMYEGGVGGWVEE